MMDWNTEDQNLQSCRSTSVGNDGGARGGEEGEGEEGVEALEDEQRAGQLRVGLPVGRVSAKVTEAIA